MNICYLFLHKLYGRGSGRYMQYLIKYFKRKNRIFLVTGMRNKLKLLKDIKYYQVHIPFQIPVYQGRSDVKKNIKISTIPDTQFFGLIRRFAGKCIRINQDFGIDIVHANHVSILPYASFLAKQINGVPYVITAHGTGMLSSLESERNFRTAKIGAENAEKIIANSQFTKNQLVKDFKIKKSKIKVIYPGVDINLFKPSSDRVKKAVRRKYKCANKKVVFAAGFFMEKKGFQDLIRAAAIYEKKTDDIVTLINGKGPYQGKLEKLIKKLGLKRTRIVGWVPREDLIKLYSAADIFVTPSRWQEPFEMVSVEALACETPVIATKVGGIPEIVRKDVGVLVNPNSPEEIAEAVMEKIFNEEWLIKAGKKGRSWVKRKFSERVSGEETENVYRKVVR